MYSMYSIFFPSNNLFLGGGGCCFCGGGAALLLFTFLGVWFIIFVLIWCMFGLLVFLS